MLLFVLWSVFLGRLPTGMTSVCAIDENQLVDNQMILTEEEIANSRATLNELEVEHRDLNLIIEHLVSTPLPDQDQLLIHRLKKRKLLLKDKIYQLERLLVPDIPA
jgi:hypothetical protein